MPHHIAFRGIFLFSSNGDIVFSERFQTVESRVPPSSQKMPTNDVLSQFFKQTCNSLGSSNGNYVFDFNQDIKLVVLPMKNFSLTIIPLIELNEQNSASHPIEVSASFSFLSFFETISKSILKNLKEDSPPSAYAPLRQLIALVLPFGSPIVHDPYFASQLCSSGDVRRFSAGYQTIAPSAVPSWKTFLVFPRPQLDLKLREVILCLVDGNNTTFSSYGEIRCISQISYLPDITMTVNHFDSAYGIASHFCVKQISDLKSIKPKTITFSPPTGITQLLLWKNRNVLNSIAPVDGVYGIREIDENGLTFSLKINVHASISVITVQLPFPDRGAITKHQFQSPGGQLKMSKKEATISWTMQISEGGSETLAGTLHFENPIDPNQKNERIKAYLSFNNKKQSFSGAEIEKESITFSASPSNIVLVTEASYSSESKKYIFLSTPLPE